MVKIVFIISVSLLASCSSIKFHSSDIIPVSLEENVNHKLAVKERIEESFYLWGMIPEQHTVAIDKIFEDKGYLAISDLEIIEVEQKRKFLWMIFSLGLYYPQTFDLVAKSTQ